MRFFMIGMGIIITTTFALGVAASSARAGAPAVSASRLGSVEGLPLVCLALAGGTALLGAIAWTSTLRRIEGTTPSTIRASAAPAEPESRSGGRS